MPLFDLPLEQLHTYQPAVQAPDDFDEFWQDALLEARNYPLNMQIEKVDTGLKLVDTYDVSFAGYGGQSIKAWLTVPAGAKSALPCVVEYLGYTRGRGLPAEHLMWANAGFAHFVMDTRGHGSSRRGSTGDLLAGDGPGISGFMTRGIQQPETYYYRRVFSDAVRAIDAARSHDVVNDSKIILTGASQGGGITIAAGALVPDVHAVMPDVPFLCHYRRAVEITNRLPYSEITQYLSIYRDHVDTVWQTLSYFDGVNFASRIRAPALFSVALMDEVCPPSTVFAAYNALGSARKSINVYPYNQHEGGAGDQLREQLRFVQNLWV